MNTKKSIYNIYISSIYRWGLFTMTCAALSAAVFYTIMKISGLYPNVPWTPLIIFDLMDISFLLISIWIIKNSVHNGILEEQKLRIGKIFTFCIEVIQWNYILYLIPSATFWGFFFFFLILICFFLDIRLILITGFSLIASLLISCKIKGQWPYLTMPDLQKADFIVFMTSILFAMAGIIIFVLFMTHIQWIYQKQEQQLRLQKKYYHQFLQKENGIQKFHHDINKHTMALEALCMEEDFESVKEYVKDLSEKNTQYSFVHTGNTIADCFVNDLINELHKSGKLTWEIIGKFPTDIIVSENDFCVIFGNAVENAKEALMLLPSERERVFYLTIKHYHEHLYICMKNTTSSNESQHNYMFFSQKRSDYSYGYGLQNIKMTVEKYGGNVEWNLNDGVFSIDINI